MKKIVKLLITTVVVVSMMSCGGVSPSYNSDGSIRITSTNLRQDAMIYTRISPSDTTVRSVRQTIESPDLVSSLISLPIGTYLVIDGQIRPLEFYDSSGTSVSYTISETLIQTPQYIVISVNTGHYVSRTLLVNLVDGAVFDLDSGDDVIWLDNTILDSQHSLICLQPERIYMEIYPPLYSNEGYWNRPAYGYIDVATGKVTTISPDELELGYSEGEIWADPSGNVVFRGDYGGLEGYFKIDDNLNFSFDSLDGDYGLWFEKVVKTNPNLAGGVEDVFGNELIPSHARAYQNPEKIYLQTEDLFIGSDGNNLIVQSKDDLNLESNMELIAFRSGEDYWMDGPYLYNTQGLGTEQMTLKRLNIVDPIAEWTCQRVVIDDVIIKSITTGFGAIFVQGIDQNALTNFEAYFDWMDSRLIKFCEMPLGDFTFSDEVVYLERLN